MAAQLLKKTLETGSDVMGSLKKQKKQNKNVIRYQEFEEEDPMEEESKETNDYAEAESPMRWNDDLTGYYEDTQELKQKQNGLQETGQYLLNQYQTQKDQNLIENQMEEVELSDEYLQLKKLPQTVKSDAWPVEDMNQNEAKAAVHNFLRDHCDQINIGNVYYRQLTQEDVLEVRNLHEEWFPLSYPDSFYNKLFRHNYIAIGCFAKLKSHSEFNKDGEQVVKEVIIGTILVKVEFGEDQVAQLYQHRDRTHDGTVGSWFRWLKSIVSCKEYIGAYIMTIGVVDECRRLGLGTQLLNKAIQVLKRHWIGCDIVYLHVVDYNQSAIQFYLNERNKFISHSIIHDHYYIMSKSYDAVLLYRDISKEDKEDNIISLNKTVPIPSQEV